MNRIFQSVALRSPARCSFPKLLPRRLLASSPSSQSQKEVEKKDEAHEIDLRTFSLTPRTVDKLPARAPLVKNFFVGEVDGELLTFPEVLEKEHVDKFLAEQKANRRRIREIGASANFLDRLRAEELFSDNVPQEFNGKGYADTEMAMHEELSAESIQAASVLGNHRIVVRLLEEFGSPTQKGQLMRRLARGEMVATVALHEEHVSRPHVLGCEATVYDDVWTLNGEKAFVQSGSNANLVLVVARTATTENLNEHQEGLVLALVDTQAPGVTVEENEILGATPNGQSKLILKNVVVPKDRVLGKLDDVPKIFLRLLRHKRIQNTAEAIPLIRQAINTIIKFSIETSINDRHPMEQEMIQNRLGNIAIDLYAIESMLYLTTSYLDLFENPDVDLEAALMKMYATRVLAKAATILFPIIGGDCTLADKEFAKIFRDSFQMAAQNEPLLDVELFVALAGLQHAGKQMKEMVIQERRPLEYPQNFWKRLLAPDDPLEGIKLTMNLIQYLHPSLLPCAQYLELGVKHQLKVVELLLKKHGKEIVNKQSDLQRIAHVAMLNYAIFASASRASRSYCIGLRHADKEMTMANVLALDAFNKIRSIANDIHYYEKECNFENYQRIANHLFKQKEYFPVHTLTRNF